MRCTTKRGCPHSLKAVEGSEAEELESKVSDIERCLSFAISQISHDQVNICQLQKHVLDSNANRFMPFKQDDLSDVQLVIEEARAN